MDSDCGSPLSVASKVFAKRTGGRSAIRRLDYDFLQRIYYSEQGVDTDDSAPTEDTARHLGSSSAGLPDMDIDEPSPQPAVGVATPKQDGQDADLWRQMETLYHQNQASLVERASIGLNLWQCPTTADGTARHLIERLFRKTCSTIGNLWDCTPEEVLPEELRARTPYSLALLLALRRVCSHSKGAPGPGKEQILMVWKARMHTIAVEAGLDIEVEGQWDMTSMPVHFFETKVDTVLQSPGATENFIQECNLGLTLEDAVVAAKCARSAMNERQWRPNHTRLANASGAVRGGTRDVTRSEAKAAKKQRKRERKAKGESDLAKRDEGQGGVIGGARVEKGPRKAGMSSAEKAEKKTQRKLEGDRGFKLLRFLEEYREDEDDGGVTLTGLEFGTVGEQDASEANASAPPNTPETNGVTQSAVRTRSMRDAQQQENLARRANGQEPKYPPTNDAFDLDGPIGVSKHDRATDNMLSQMFNKVDVKRDETLPAKRVRNLIKKSAKHEYSLPSERVKLGSMPTLYAQQGMRLQEEAFAGIEKMKLGGGDGEENVGAGGGEEGDEKGGVSLAGAGEEDEEL